MNGPQADFIRNHTLHKARDERNLQFESSLSGEMKVCWLECFSSQQMWGVLKWTSLNRSPESVRCIMDNGSCGLTDTSENITFSHLRWRAVKTFRVLRKFLCAFKLPETGSMDIIIKYFQPDRNWLTGFVCVWNSAICLAVLWPESEPGH